MLSSLAISAVPLLLAGLQATAVNAIPTISAVGSKFFYEDGTQYYVKGTSNSFVLSFPQCELTVSRCRLSAHSQRSADRYRAMQA